MSPRILTLAILLSGVSLTTATDPSHVTWERLIDKTAEEKEIFVSQSTTMILDGVYTWVPVLTFGHDDDRDAALALFRELDGKFTKWAHDQGGQSSLKDFNAKYGSPPPPGGSFLALYSFANGSRIQMSYRAPAKDAKALLTVTFLDFPKIQSEMKG